MNKEILKLAIDSLQISMVYIRESNITNYNDFDPLISGQQLFGQMKIQTVKHDFKSIEIEGEKTKFVRFFIDAGMRTLAGLAPDKIGDDEELLSKYLATEITVTYVAEYVITNEEKLNEEAIKEFGRFNAPYNIWPFLREYLYSQSGRMSMPASLIPMFKIDAAVDEKKQEEVKS
jgi:hypothetical protein